MADDDITRAASPRTRRTRAATTSAPKAPQHGIDDFLGGGMVAPPAPAPAPQMPQAGGWVTDKGGAETYAAPPKDDPIGNGGAFKVDMGAFRAAAGRAAEGAPFEMPAGSVHAAPPTAPVNAPVAPPPLMTPGALDDALNGQRRGNSPDLPPAYGRIVRTTFAFDPEKVFNDLNEKLSLPRPVHEMGYVELAECLDDAARRHRDASRLFAHAKVTLAEFEADCEAMRGDMRAQAVAQLKAEKEEKGGKQITDGDVTARMATIFPDEYRRQESLKAKAKATVGHLETMVKVWELRRREIDGMLRECRNRV